MPDDERYSLTELADLAGVTPRTVRYYLAQGLLPAVGQSGPGSKYEPAHLARLRLIRRLQAEHLPLAEIRHRLDSLGDDDIRELAGLEPPAPPTDSALDYLRSVLGTPATDAAGYAMAPGVRPPGVRPPSVRPPSGPPKRIPEPPVRRLLSERLSPAYRSEPAPVTADVPGSTGAGGPIERSQWERIVLAPDVELHLRRPLGRAQNKQIDRLVTIARELLEEDTP
jgi:DNA-binding transcriptional MerR regulator